MFEIRKDDLSKRKTPVGAFQEKIQKRKKISGEWSADKPQKRIHSTSNKAHSLTVRGCYSWLHALSLLLIPVLYSAAGRVAVTMMPRVRSWCGITGNWRFYLSTSSSRSRAPSQPRRVTPRLGEVGGKPLRGNVGVCVGGRCRLSETGIMFKSRG